MSSSRDELLAGLSSSTPSERARAAAWLLVHTQDISTRELVRALQAETVPQVRRVLLEVLERRQKASVVSKPAATDRVVPPDGEDASASEASADAGEIASMVRHELAPAVGWIRLSLASATTPPADYEAFTPCRYPRHINPTATVRETGSGSGYF